ncbi:MAG: hypothetical protein E7Z84_02030 [Methanosphaera stadtmanae]|nr:hypothetical protein [Methanosphaera stadtmanae]
MYNKKSLLIISFVILITVMVSINSITAAQTNETNDNINSEKTSYTTQVNTYDQLKTEVNNAKKSDADEYIINLEKNNYTINQHLTWKSARGQTRTLIINGNNSIIQGNNETRFIEIGTGYTLKIYNLTIENTKENVGSAILNYGDTTLNNITINKNTITKQVYGGVITNIGGTIKINNSNIINNTSPNSTCGISTTNNGTTIIENSYFLNNHAENALIYNFINSTTIIKYSYLLNNTSNSILFNDPKAITSTLTNSTICQNKANNIISNNKELEIINTSIENNTAKNILYNKENMTTISDSTIYNNTCNYTLKIDSGKLDVINSVFIKNNAIYNIIYQNESLINVLDSVFINNTSNELFYSEKELFNTVTNNKYYGNQLGNTSITVNNKTYNFDEKIVVNGTVKTHEIYNTTVNSGIIEIYENNTPINKTIVENGRFEFDGLENRNYELQLLYSGQGSYVDTNTSTSIHVVLPEYSINISVDEDNVNYHDDFNYSISITNIGEGNGTNITINNIVPLELIYLSCNDDNYSQQANQWHIDNLNSNQTKVLKINTKVNSTKNFNISINNLENSVNKTILIKKPSYQMELISDNKNYLYGSTAKYNLTITNIGNGTGFNINISINSNHRYGLSKFNFENIEKLDANKSFTISFTKKVLKTGNISTLITLRDIFNITKSDEHVIFVKMPSIELEPIITHIGDTVNIKANIIDINQYNNGSIIFKVNGLTIKNHEIEVNNTSVKLLNYLINPSWKSNNYTIQVKYYEKGFENIIEDASTLTIKKIVVYSIIENVTSYFNEYVNFTAYIHDDNNNPVNSGKVIFKINGISIKENKIIKNGFVQIENYYISSDNFGKTEYNLELVYSGNNLYNSNRNYSMIKLVKINTLIDITNTTNKKGETYTISGLIKNSYNKTVNKGYIIIKINGLSLEKAKITNGSYTYSFISPTSKIKNITVVYSGNNYMYSNKKTVNFYENPNLKQYKPASLLSKIFSNFIDYSPKNRI